LGRPEIGGFISEFSIKEAVVEMKKINELEKRLDAFDKKYEKGPALAKRLERARRKYSAITQEDLQKQFTI
jgi:hypothetical protein